jgi:hypothetical protein
MEHAVTRNEDQTRDVTALSEQVKVLKTIIKTSVDNQQVFITARHILDLAARSGTDGPFIINQAMVKLQALFDWSNDPDERGYTAGQTGC